MTSAMGLDDSQLLIKYLGQEYELSRFRKFHPGGANTLARFRGKDIGEQLRATQHSQAAYSLMEDYAKSARAPDIDEVSMDPLFSPIANFLGRGMSDNS